MGLSDKQMAFLQQNRSAAMTTNGADGFAKVARVGVVIVDGRIWSSATRDRVRTRRLRRDPRSTLFVFEAMFAWLALETTVSIREGEAATRESVRLFREMQAKPSGPLSWFGRELDEDEFEQAMADEGRLIYDFEVHRAYGLH